MAPLHVGLNLVYWVPDSGGSGTYARELIRALHVVEPGTRITAWVGRGAPTGLDTVDWGGDTTFVHLPVASTGSPLHVGYELAIVGLDARRRGVDVVHGLAYTSPLVAPGLATVVTLLDLTWLHHPGSVSPLARTMFRLLTATCGRAADRIIAISAHVQDDLVATLGIPRTRIDVTPLGFASRPLPAATDPVVLRDRHGLPRDVPVVLHVGQVAAHKNLGVVLEALPSLPPDTHVVLCGRQTPHVEQVRSLADRLGVDRRVVFSGFVDEADLEGLYALARVVVVPSVSEGFGLPVLEAMRRGVPVACSAASALPEVAGDAALLFDPRSTLSVASAVGALLEDPVLRRDLGDRGRSRAAAFTGEAMARATLASYRRALG